MGHNLLSRSCIQSVKLQSLGKPIEYVVYPDADYGILSFEKSAQGERRLLGYEPDYFKRQVEWLQQHGG